MAVVLIELVGVKDALVGARFVEEPLALGVDLQERLAAHPEHAGFTALDLGAARNSVRLEGRTVEHHHAVGLVELAARPDASLDAVAGGAGNGAIQAHNGQVLGLERLQHIIVQRVTAGGNDDTLGCVDPYIAAVLILGDGAGDPAIFFDQLDHWGIVAELHPQGQGIVGQNLGAVQLVALAVVAALPLGRMAGGKVDVAGAFVIAARLVPELNAPLGQPVAIPVDGLAGLLGPELYQPLIQTACGGLGHLGNIIKLVDLGAPFLLVTAVDGAQIVPHTAGSQLVNDQGLGAVLPRAAGSEQTASAAAHHQDFGVQGLDDLAVGDLRLVAQPGRGAVVHGNRFFLFHSQAHSLLDAAGRRLLDRFGSDGCARNAVDLGALGGHQGLLELLGRVDSHINGLLGGVYLHLGDGAVAEGHGNGNCAHASLGSGIGTRGVDAGVARGCGGSCCFTAVLASGQGRCGGGAHSRHGSNAQKTFAGNLFHRFFSFFLMICRLTQSAPDGL